MKTTLSEKRQVSIPKELCDQLALKPGSKIVWETDNGKLIGSPLPENILDKLTGIHKGGPDLVARLLRTRREDYALEQRKLARHKRASRPVSR